MHRHKRRTANTISTHNMNIIFISPLDLFFCFLFQGSTLGGIIRLNIIVEKLGSFHKT
ncbi:hypothetical protein L873DRAFT_975348 [Choiromyces venosus 120613-1]|uniref:Uncharacterized protein n=1 Tax=Choiromyces venosus 120613-1 TaxID=1336337 RepID=A0A3N4JLP4_9PEZI|nr:hypothetical protein L873DRAFT_975348 [Choiromyces venosus 120613-1]